MVVPIVSLTESPGSLQVLQPRLQVIVLPIVRVVLLRRGRIQCHQEMLYLLLAYLWPLDHAATRRRGWQRGPLAWGRILRLHIVGFWLLEALLIILLLLL